MHAEDVGSYIAQEALETVEEIEALAQSLHTIDAPRVLESLGLFFGREVSSMTQERYW